MMKKTKNALPENIRQDMIPLLQAQLASGIDLAIQAKQAHWNARGPRFLMLHELYDRVHNETEEAIDRIAERIAQLGGSPAATVQAVAKATALPEHPLGTLPEAEQIETLATSIATYGKLTLRGIELAARGSDPATADILTQALRKADLQLWFIESHLAPADLGRSTKVKDVA